MEVPVPIVSVRNVIHICDERLQFVILVCQMSEVRAIMLYNKVKQIKKTFSFIVEVAWARANVKPSRTRIIN